MREGGEKGAGRGIKTRRGKFKLITFSRVRDLKNSGKDGSAVGGPYLRLELSDSSCVLFSTELSSKTGLIFYLADFHSRNWRIPGFYENKTPH